MSVARRRWDSWERRYIIVVWFIGGDIVPRGWQYHYFFMLVARSSLEWCWAVVVWLLGIDSAPGEQYE